MHQESKNVPVTFTEWWYLICYINNWNSGAGLPYKWVGWWKTTKKITVSYSTSLQGISSSLCKSVSVFLVSYVPNFRQRKRYHRLWKHRGLWSASSSDGNTPYKPHWHHSTHGAAAGERNRLLPLIFLPNSILSWFLSTMPALIPVDNTLGALFIGTVLSSMCVSLSVIVAGPDRA